MKNSAFTLIELLVVVLIIGILAAIALPQYQKAVDKARLSEAFILGKHIRELEEIYYMANGNYTDNFEDLGLDVPGGYEINKNAKYELKNGSGQFHISTSRVIFYFYPRDNSTLELSLFFWYKDGNGIAQVNKGKIRCYSYTDYGTELCKTLISVPMEKGGFV
ncbi:MAG: prepilin-type N-terminal cleavage/methylation domain-containing protein [Elusimicrobiaceae bacterium]|nr:prepilin-type N-terminal cleavage/methylation domain-containing protein [Elusimicrobiaceae bacterium]